MNRIVCLGDTTRPLMATWDWLACGRCVCFIRVQLKEASKKSLAQRGRAQREAIPIVATMDRF